MGGEPQLALIRMLKTTIDPGNPATRVRNEPLADPNARLQCVIFNVRVYRNLLDELLRHDPGWTLSNRILTARRKKPAAQNATSGKRPVSTEIDADEINGACHSDRPGKAIRRVRLFHARAHCWTCQGRDARRAPGSQRAVSTRREEAGGLISHTVSEWHNLGLIYLKPKSIEAIPRFGDAGMLAALIAVTEQSRPPRRHRADRQSICADDGLRAFIPPAAINAIFPAWDGAIGQANVALCHERDRQGSPRHPQLMCSSCSASGQPSLAYHPLFDAEPDVHAICGLPISRMAEAAGGDAFYKV